MLYSPYGRSQALSFALITLLSSPSPATCVQLREEPHRQQHFQHKKDDSKHINEYEIMETIGKGSFGKIKRVVRSEFNEQQEIVKSVYAMKVTGSIESGSPRVSSFAVAYTQRRIGRFAPSWCHPAEICASLACQLINAVCWVAGVQ